MTAFEGHIEVPGGRLWAQWAGEGSAVVLSDALELENLDFNEFQATVEDMSLAVANHQAKLSKFTKSA